MDLKDREESKSERIGTVEQQTAEKQATISVEKNPKQTPLVDIANENMEIASRVKQNTDIENENQTVVCAFSNGNGNVIMFIKQCQRKPRLTEHYVTTNSCKHIFTPWRNTKIYDNHLFTSQYSINRNS